MYHCDLPVAYACLLGVQERDAMGWGRERSNFFGFGQTELQQFRTGWEVSTAFAAHYGDGGAPSLKGCGVLA